MTFKQTATIKTIVLPIALIAGMIRITIDYATKILHTGPLFYYATFFISFVLEICLITFLIRRYKRRNKNLLNLKDGIKIAVATMVIIGLLFASYSFLYNTYIDPNFQTNTAIAWGELFGQGDKVREEISKNTANNSLLGIFFVILQFSFFGFIIGVTVSSILKTQKYLN